MNTLVVFAVAAPTAFGVIMGSLVAMAWVEKRMIGTVPVARPARVTPAHRTRPRLVRLPAAARPRSPHPWSPRPLTPSPSALRGRPRTVMSVAVGLFALVFAVLSMGRYGHVPEPVRGAAPEFGREKARQEAARSSIPAPRARVHPPRTLRPRGSPRSRTRAIPRS